MGIMVHQEWRNLISDSQRKCLRLVNEGMSSKEIAIQTGLSPRTVDQYVNNAARALGVSNRREAARMLASLETEPLKKLQLKPERVAPPGNPDNLNGVEQDAGLGHRRWKILRWLPPLGGKRHDLTYSEAILEVIKVALIAAAGFGSIVATGAWLQSLFN